MASHTIHNLIGHVFGRLTVIDETVGITGKGERLRKWHCLCSCGQERIVSTANLLHSTRSCGCLKKDLRETRTKFHRQLPAREVKIWDGMVQRCTNPKNTRFEDYGGRGITVSDRWRTFVYFLDDMGPCPDGYTLDRIDNNGPYTGPCETYPNGNCRWATQKEQMRNKRNTRLITYLGQTMCLTDWAAKIGINKITLFQRFRHGWTLERAMTIPARSRPRHDKISCKKAQHPNASW